MKLLKVMRGVKPLVVVSGGLIASKRNNIYFYPENGDRHLLFKIDDSWFSLFWDIFPLLFRLRRSGVGCAIQFMDDCYFSYRKKIFRFEGSSGGLSESFEFSRGRGPLKFSLIQGINGFSDCIVFGEYFGNRSKDKVHIYRKMKDREWEIAHTFGSGEINHVHNVVPDPHRKCVWILTGDFGNSACIYRATNDFSSVERIVYGTQQCRSCVAFPTYSGLLFATDTQLEYNYLMLLVDGERGWKTERLHELNGSCIYGCETKDYFVFSTSTEPDVEKTGRISALFDNKPGRGIKSNRSDVLVCRKADLRIEKVFSREKDIFPYRLFQFGTVAFPNGSNDSNMLYAYNVGSTKNDLCSEVWNLS